MFEGKWSDLEGLGEMKLTMDFAAEEEGVGFDGIGSHGAEDFDLPAAHESKTDWGLHVGFEFSLDEKRCSIDLGLPSGGKVVTVECECGVIEKNEGGL